MSMYQELMNAGLSSALAATIGAAIDNANDKPTEAALKDALVRAGVDVNAAGVLANRLLSQQQSSASTDSPWNLVRKVLPYTSFIPGFGSSSSADYSSVSFNNIATPSTAMPVIDMRRNTFYPAGAVRANNGKILKNLVAGTTGAIFAASASATPQADGGCSWMYLRSNYGGYSNNTAFVFGQYLSNGGFIYACTTAGTSAATGGGPSANSSSIIDGTCVFTRIQEQWIDSVSGSDTNDGLTPLTPKASLPSSLVANTHYWVFAGSKFFYDALTTPTAISFASACSSMTVVDRNTFNEVTSQPNPYLRGLRGEWVTSSEKAEKYFEIYSNSKSFVDTQVNASYGRCFRGTANGNSWFILRGAWVHNFFNTAVGAFGAPGGYTLVSDCIFESNSLASVNTSANPSGFAVRYEGATANGSHLLQRCFIYSDGEDAIWFDSNPQAQDVRLYDLAIVHRASTKFTSSHSDAIQFNRYPGNLRIRRCIIEHDLSNVSNLDGSPPIGAALIQDNTGAISTETMEVTDCVIASNSTVSNIQNVGSGAGFQRNVFGLIHVTGKVQGQSILHASNQAWTLTNCVNVMDTQGTIADRRYQGPVPTYAGIVLDLYL